MLIFFDSCEEAEEDYASIETMNPTWKPLNKLSEIRVRFYPSQISLVRLYSVVVDLFYFY